MPKIVNREQYRHRLLQESFELFAEIGYGNITMRQLAQRLGVSTGTLYHYFPNKETIFLQLVTQLTEQDTANFLAQAESIPADIRSRVRAILDFMKTNLDYFIKQMLVGIDYNNHIMQAGKKIDPIFGQLDRQTIKEIDDYLQIDNLELAEFIFMFMGGLMLNQMYNPDLALWERQSNLLVEIVAVRVNNPSG